MTQTFRPFNDFIQVRPISEGERKSKGGLFLPGTVSSAYVRAEVVALSEGIFVPETGSMRRPRVIQGEIVWLIHMGDGEVGYPGPDNTRLIREVDIVGVETPQ